MRALFSAFLGGLIPASTTSANAQDIDWQMVDLTLGRKPAISGDVHRYGFPKAILR